MSFERRFRKPVCGTARSAGGDRSWIAFTARKPIASSAESSLRNGTLCASRGEPSCNSSPAGANSPASDARPRRKAKRQSSACQPNVGRCAFLGPDRNLVHAAAKLTSATTGGPFAIRLHHCDPGGEIGGAHQSSSLVLSHCDRRASLRAVSIAASASSRVL